MTFTKNYAPHKSGRNPARPKHKNNHDRFTETNRKLALDAFQVPPDLQISTALVAQLPNKLVKL